MNILVLGGSGFLGSHVCDQLSEADQKVRIYDCVEPPWLRPEQEMIVGDLLDEIILEKAIAGCDVVYNFAGKVVRHEGKVWLKLSGVSQEARLKCAAYASP